MSSITSLFDKTSQKKISNENGGKFPEVWRKEYYKTYPRFPQIELPEPKKLLIPLDKAIVQRKSTRQFTRKEISLKTFSTLLYYSAGIRALPEKDIRFTRRVYPSAGARYPLEVYLSISGNTYHYNVQTHSLEKLPFIITNKVLTTEIFQGANGNMIDSASAIFFISSVFQRSYIKYGDASFRYICMEAGHLMQNIYLVGEALGLECCAIGGFVDRNASKLFCFDPTKERMLYIGILGGRRPTPHIPLDF